MTAKEAIMILESIQPSCGGKYSYSESEIYEALDMAIEVLRCSEIPNSSDTIYRQDVNDALEKVASFFPYRIPGKGETYDKYNEAWNDAIGRAEMEIKQLPSAQPEPIRINLNEPIKVKLTDWGKEIYYHQYDRTNQIAGKEICKPKFPKEDENGYTEFQLWCFMELYGECMGMTLPNVIEPLEIVYER